MPKCFKVVLYHARCYTGALIYILPLPGSGDFPAIPPAETGTRIHLVGALPPNVSSRTAPGCCCCCWWWWWCAQISVTATTRPCPLWRGPLPTSPAHPAPVQRYTADQRLPQLTDPLPPTSCPPN